VASRDPPIILSRAERDALLRRRGLLIAYHRQEPYFREPAHQAFDLAAGILAGAAEQLHRPVSTLMPQSEDCVIALTTILQNDDRWYKICRSAIGFSLGSFVRQITRLMAEFLVDTYWATLVVGS
jgi:hypothetical protein